MHTFRGSFDLMRQVGSAAVDLSVLEVIVGGIDDDCNFGLLDIFSVEFNAESMQNTCNQAEQSVVGS
jgi:hypothetical protein